MVGLGVAVAVGTARPYHAALGPFKEVGVVGEAISSGGADVRRADGTVVAREPMSREAALFLAELCDRAAWTPTVATAEGMVMGLDQMPEWLDRAPPTTRVVQSLSAEKLDDMLSIVTGVEGAPELVAELEAHPELRVQRAFTRDGSVLVTVTKAGVDKGTGLLALCEALGIRPEEAVAFGDSEVDVPMFAAAGLGLRWAMRLTRSRRRPGWSPATCWRTASRMRCARSGAFS